MFLSPRSARSDPEDVVYPGKTLLPGEIRLIRLLPGTWTDPVRCELFEETLGTTKYEALSYVWGSKNVTRPIFLNQRKFPVTVNLESALRHLRERPEWGSDGAVLWVDALCINQKDGSERTTQVQMMGNIYRRCWQAIVYLGGRLEDGTRNDRPPAPRRYEPWYGNNRGRQERRASAVGDIFDMFEGLADPKLQHLAEFLPSGNFDAIVFYENLRRMMHPPFTPWWSRIWVIQEVTVPREVNVVYGTATAPWAVFATAARNYNSHSTSCCLSFVKSLPRDQAKVLDDCFSRISAIDDLRKGHYAYVHKDPVNRYGGSQTWPLLDLLRKFRDRKATDPRDKVYALLGIAQMSTPMIPDYSWTDVGVFVRATLECIYGENSLSVLSTDLGRKFRGDLPSWVPDWGAPGGSIYQTRATIVELYDACPQDRVADYTTVSVCDTNNRNKKVWPYRISATLLPSHLLLQMQGSKLGTINRIDDVMWGGDVARIWQSTLTRWCKAYEKWDDAWREKKTFWRIICADVVCKSEQGTDFRRTVPGDELAFMMWTDVSERSPKVLAKDEYWSAEARAWRDIHILWGDKVSWGATDPLTGLYNTAKIKTDEDFKPLRHCWPPVPPDGQTYISRLLELVRFAEMDVDEPKIEASGEIQRDYPWEALLSHSTARLLQKFGLYFDLNVQTQSKLVPAIETAITTATLSRRLIASDNYVGLGPANTQVNDELYLLGGGKSPFVLHPVGGTPGRDIWDSEIIGDCYVHDRMDFSKEVTGYDGEWHTTYIC
jgi:hypothetical protein